MSNYKDICDFSTNTQQRTQAFSSAEGDAPSVPWSELSFLDQSPGASSSVSTDDLDLNLEGNQASVTRSITPKPEFIRAGNLDKFYSGGRIVKIYPQQFVYNFPATKRSSNLDITYEKFIDKDSIFEVGTRDIIFPAVNKGIRLPPSENRENYHSQESVVNVVNSQDPLRYCHGSIFLGNRIDDEARPQSWRSDASRFYSYNPFPKLREGLDNAPDEEGEFGAAFAPTFKMWSAASLDPKLRIEMTLIKLDENNPGNGAEFFEYPPPGMPNGSEIKYFKKFKIKSVKIESLAFRDIYPSLGWASGVEYLKNIIKENKTFYDFRFRSNAAFFEEEKDFFTVAPLSTVNIECKIVNPDLLESKNQKSITTNQLTTNQENSDYYEIGSVERTLPNIYREYLKANKDVDPLGQWQRFQDRNINVNRWLEESCNETNVEIYGTYEVRKMQEINNIILGYIEQEGQRFQERQRWISQHTNAFVEVSFKMPSSFTAEEKENFFLLSHGDFASLGDNSQHPQRVLNALDDPQVSSFLLSLIDFGFTSSNNLFGNYHDTITAFASEQFLYIDESSRSPRESREAIAEAGSTIQNVGNEKTVFNYRPRTIEFRSEDLKRSLENSGKQYGQGNIIHTLQNLACIMFPSGNGNDNTIANIKEHYEPSKYPLGYRGFHYLYDIDPAYDQFDPASNFSEGLIKRFHNLANKTIQSNASTVAGRNSYFFPYGRHNQRRDLGVDDWVRQKWKLLHPEELFSANRDFHSEIIAFRMEKINSNTGKVIKEYYFWNNQLQGDADFKYLDTQILAGAKYIYNIYAINLVLGAEYKYSNVRASGDPQDDGRPAEPDAPPAVLVDIDYSPCFKIIETPYYSQLVSVVDLPPIYPTVELLKYEITEQQEQSFMFKFSENLGTLIEAPIPILAEDQEIFQQARQAQLRSKLIDNSDENFKKIKFSSDTKATHYEIFILNEKPTSVRDFSRGEYFKIDSSDLVFPFIPEPNRDKYFIFRTRDFNGVSNPTQIFRFRYNVYGDGDYYEFDLYEIEEAETVDKMCFERLLSIEPATMQKILTIPKISTNDNPDDTVYDLSSAPSINNISFHNDSIDLKLWGKKFKIRIKSRSTGKEIDFNLDFSYTKKIVQQEQEPPAEDRCPDKSSNQNAAIIRSESQALTNIATSLSEPGGNEGY